MVDNNKKLKPVKLGIILIVIGLILITSITGIFIFFFYAQNFSENINDWGAFGSYIGGVLGTSISILALIGAVIAIYQQQKIEERVNKHTIASDLIKSIERLEDSIDQPLKGFSYRFRSNIGLDVETNAFRLLTQEYPKAIIEGAIPKWADPQVVSDVLLRQKLSENELLQKVATYELFSVACGKLRFMRDLLIEHKNIVGHNVMTIYYAKKYQRAVEKLRDAEYPVESWKDIQEMNE